MSQLYQVAVSGCAISMCQLDEKQGYENSNNVAVTGKGTP